MTRFHLAATLERLAIHESPPKRGFMKIVFLSALLGAGIFVPAFAQDRPAQYVAHRRLPYPKPRDIIGVAFAEVMRPQPGPGVSPEEWVRLFVNTEGYCFNMARTLSSVSKTVDSATFFDLIPAELHIQTRCETTIELLWLPRPPLGEDLSPNTEGVTMELRLGPVTATVFARDELVKDRGFEGWFRRYSDLKIVKNEER